MNVSQEAKLNVLAGILDPLLAALAASASDNDVSADDIIDFFSLGIAAVIENDSHLTSARHYRQAVETTAKRIEAGVKAMGVYHREQGESFWAAVMNQPRPAPTVN